MIYCSLNQVKSNISFLIINSWFDCIRVNCVTVYCTWLVKLEVIGNVVRPYICYALELRVGWCSFTFLDTFYMSASRKWVAGMKLGVKCSRERNWSLTWQGHGSGWCPPYKVIPDICIENGALLFQYMSNCEIIDNWACQGVLTSSKLSTLAKSTRWFRFGCKTAVSKCKEMCQAGNRTAEVWSASHQVTWQRKTW